MQTNTQANIADSPVKSEALKDNQFRIDAVPPVRRYWSVMRRCLMSRGSFCATAG